MSTPVFTGLLAFAIVGQAPLGPPADAPPKNQARQDLEIRLELPDQWQEARTQRTSRATFTEYVRKGGGLKENSEIIAHTELAKSESISMALLYEGALARFREMKCEVEQPNPSTTNEYQGMQLIYHCPALSLYGVSQFVDGGGEQLHSITYEIKGAAPSNPIRTKLIAMVQERIRICRGGCAEMQATPSPSEERGTPSMSLEEDELQLFSN